MTQGPATAIEAVIDRIDWVANRGSFVMRAGAIFAWAGAIAASVVVFSRAGFIGWLIGALCLSPGWMLWRYGKNLATSFDANRMRGQLGAAATLAKGRLVEVVAGVQDTRRRFFRGGFKVLRTVRGLRTDLEGLGIDISGITQVTNPAGLAVAGFSLLGALSLWMIAVAGVVLRIIF